MRANFLLLSVALAYGLWAGGCADRVAGGSEIGNPAALAGVAVDSGGGSRAGVALRLLPENYDPQASGAAGDTLKAESDSQGHYLFPRVKPGGYVLTAVDPLTGFRFFSRVTAKSGVRAQADTLRAPGRVVVEVSDSIPAGTYVFIPGTLDRAWVDASGRAVLDSVPAGFVPIEQRSAAAGSTRLDSLRVPEAGTARAFSAGSQVTGKLRWVSPGQDIQAAVDSLAPGDTLFIRGGAYYLAHLGISLKGRPGARITIRNQPGENPILRGTSDQYNLIHFNGAEYVDLEGLEIDSTMEGSDALKFEEGDTTHHVSIRGFRIHHIHGIAINEQGNHHHISIEGNEIHHTLGTTGTAIRIADATGKYSPTDWTVEGNWIHHCAWSDAGGSGAIHVFPGARNVIVRDNMLHDNAHEGIRMYGRFEENPQGEGISLVEGNAIWNSGAGLLALSDVIVRNNVVFACSVMVVSQRYNGSGSQPSGKLPENLSIYNNTFYGGTEITLLDWDAARQCVFANNAVYGTASPWEIRGTGIFSGNVGDQASPGFTMSSALIDLDSPANRSFQPRIGSALLDKAVRPWVAENDFQGSPRDSAPDVGAFEYRGPATGPALEEGFKRR